jgi:hypothetical protein
VNQDSEGARKPMAPGRSHHGSHFSRSRDGHWGSKSGDTDGMVSDTEYMGHELDGVYGS